MKKLSILFLFASLLVSCSKDDEPLGLVGHYYIGAIGSRPEDNLPYSMESRITREPSGFMVRDCKVITNITVFHPADIVIEPTNNNRNVTFSFKEGDQELTVINFTTISDQYSTAHEWRYTSPHESFGGHQGVFTRL